VDQRNRAAGGRDGFQENGLISFPGKGDPRRLKPSLKNMLVIASLKRCAAQNHTWRRVFPQPVKPLAWRVLTAWLKPCPFKTVPELT